MHDRCSAPTLVRTTVPSSPSLPACAQLRCCRSCGAAYRTDVAYCGIDGAEIVVTNADPLIGAAIAQKYVLETLIGAGAMGRVYRAHHSRLLHKRYAVKILFGDLASSASARMRFAHEAESASVLDHPNIVSVVDVGCTEVGLLYLVMELVDGPSLGRLLEQGPLSIARVVRIARQLCEGLGHAHSHGFVHRDFKPDNILVVGEPGSETVRICDFGLAISVNEGNDARLTTSGVVCTPAYAAPEQLLGRPVDHRADLHALGVTLYEMLSGGKLPFAHGSNEVLFKVSGEAPLLSSVVPETPSALVAMIASLLARDPNDRPASTGDVIEALEAIALAPTLPFQKVDARVWSHPVGLGLAVATTLALGTAMAAAFGFGEVTASSPPPADVTGVDEPLDLHIAWAVAREAPVERIDASDEAPSPPPRRRFVATMGGARPGPLRPVATSMPVPADQGPATLVTAATGISAIDAVLRPETTDRMEVSMLPVPAPTPPPSVAPRPAPDAPPVRVRTPRLIALEVSGGLPYATVKRAIEHVLPDLGHCSTEIGPRTIDVKLSIDETRRVRIDGSGSPCIANRLALMRTDAAPDTGDAHAELRLAF